MPRLTESQFIDRFIARVCELHPGTEPTDLLDFAVNNYDGADDMEREEAAELFAAEIANHWLSIGKRPIPTRRQVAS